MTSLNDDIKMTLKLHCFQVLLSKILAEPLLEPLKVSHNSMCLFEPRCFDRFILFRTSSSVYSQV